MAKFHINPKTGEPGSCKATQGGCPFGGDEAHYGSAEDARKAFELSMAGKEYVEKRQQTEREEDQRKHPEKYKVGPTGKGIVDSYWRGGFSSSILPGSAGVAEIAKAATLDGATLQFGIKSIFDSAKKWRQFKANGDNTWSEYGIDNEEQALKRYSSDDVASFAFRGVGKNPELKKTLEGFRIHYPTPKHVAKWKDEESPYDEDVISYKETQEGVAARAQALDLYSTFMANKPSAEELKSLTSTPSDPYFAENLPGEEHMFWSRLDQRDRDSLGTPPPKLRD